MLNIYSKESLFPVFENQAEKNTLLFRLIFISNT